MTRYELPSRTVVGACHRCGRAWEWGPKFGRRLKNAMCPHCTNEPLAQTWRGAKRWHWQGGSPAFGWSGPERCPSCGHARSSHVGRACAARGCASCNGFPQ